jgi:hypothetical protein
MLHVPSKTAPGLVTIECSACYGGGRVPLPPASQETLDAVTVDWSSTRKVGSRMRRRIKGPALANRLSELRGLGLVESRPATDARALEWRRKE